MDTLAFYISGFKQHSCLHLVLTSVNKLTFSHRQAGVRNGMFFGKAKQLCPSLQSVPYDFEAYKEVALTMYEILAG